MGRANARDEQWGQARQYRPDPPFPLAVNMLE